MSNVIHPGHYNITGRKECIEEMLDKFGYEKTEAFCELNSYKYKYRHKQKNGQEDLDKATNYQNMLQRYMEEDPRFRIAEHFGITSQQNQLIEEMAELTQALTKWNRKCDFGQVITSGLNVKDLEEHIFEELSDVKLVLDQVIYLMGCGDQVQKIMKQKIDRTFERIGEQNAGN